MGMTSYSWRRFRNRLIGGFATTLLWPLAQAPAQGQTPAPAQAANSASTITLAECLKIAHDQQPALIAHRASLSAAVTQSDGLNRLPGHGLVIARDLPLRRQQACLGVTIA